jgi:hypothetical protein
MSEKPVEAYTQSQSPGHPMQKQCDEQPTPGEEEERRHCAEVKRHHDKCNFPIQPVLTGLIAPSTVKW